MCGIDEVSKLIKGLLGGTKSTQNPQSSAIGVVVVQENPETYEKHMKKHGHGLGKNGSTDTKDKKSPSSTTLTDQTSPTDSSSDSSTGTKSMYQSKEDSQLGDQKSSISRPIYIPNNGIKFWITNLSSEDSTKSTLTKRKGKEF